jgi:3-oxoacyl-[acyl-carrier-protein] synthase II
MQALHALQTEQMADGSLNPASASRPFDKNRAGMVAGEGAGMVILEELQHALRRKATIYAEVTGSGSSNVADCNLLGRCDVALVRAMKATLDDAARTPEDVGHINAHGLGTRALDVEEARAIGNVFGDRAAKVPVVALKSYFGNLGAGSGAVELIGSILAWSDGHLPRTLNYETPDPDCPLAVTNDDQKPPGGSFLTLSVTPQGQAAALYVAQYVPG